MAVLLGPESKDFVLQLNLTQYKEISKNNFNLKTKFNSVLAPARLLPSSAQAQAQLG
jgi:hypothetical protein